MKWVYPLLSVYIVKDSGYEMAAHYTPEFGTYGVDIFVVEDEEQKALEIIGSCID